MSSDFFEGYIASEGADQDVIKVKRIYIDICGDNLTDAVLFSQVMYWHGRDKRSGETRLRVMRNGHMWLAKRYEDWWDECRINASTARDAIKRLCKLKLIEKRLFHFDGKPIVHIRVVHEVFEQLITAALKAQQERERAKSSLNRRNLSDGIDGIRSMGSTESVDYYTETTTETTDKDDSAAQAPPEAPTPKIVKQKRATAKVKTLADLDQLQRVVAINGHRVKPDQGLTRDMMVMINLSVKEMRERFPVPVESEELASAYKWHCAQEGNLAAPKRSVAVGDMVQAYRDAHPFKLSSSGNLNPADPDCPMCEGQGVYSYDVPYGDPRFGKTEVCACRKPGTQEAAA